MTRTAPQKTPVTVLTGYRGAGKTTLLNRILPETGPDPAAWLPVFHEKRRQV